jgi:hypothetical protein
VGQEKREEAAARKIKARSARAQRSNLRSAISALQKFCRRNDHSDFEISLREKIIWRGNTFESLFA